MKKKSSYWVGAGAISMIERVSILVFGVIGFILLVRLLDKEDYGVWMLYLTVITLVDTARHGFFKNPLIRFINMDEGDSVDLQGTSFTLHIFSSIIISLLLLIAAYPLSILWKAPGIVTLFYINLLTNLFHTLFFHLEYVSKAKMLFKGPAFGYFTKGLVFVCCITYFYFSGATLSLWNLGVFYALAAFLASIVSYLFARDLIGKKFVFHREKSARLFAYGKYTLGTNISAVLLRYIDTWMIGFYISPVAVATYNVSIRIANLFELPSMALATILYPKAVIQAQKEGEAAFKRLYEQSVAILLIIVIPLVAGVIIFSDQIVLLLAGEEYFESSAILKVTMLYGLIVPFNKQMGILLDAIGKAKTNMMFVMRNAGINLVLNAIAIPYFGTIGAAYATLSTFLIILIINQIYLNRNYGVELTQITRDMWDFKNDFLSKISRK